LNNKYYGNAIHLYQKQTISTKNHGGEKNRDEEKEMKIEGMRK